MPDVVLKGAKEFGGIIRKKFSNPVGSTKGTGQTVELDPGQETTIETVVTMEGLATGQRIAEYVIEAEVNGSWKEIASHHTVGHKKIDRLKEPITKPWVTQSPSTVRPLTVLSARGNPVPTISSGTHDPSLSIGPEECM